MVALDLALGHRVIGLAAGVGHAVLREPGAELGGEVGRPVVAQQPRPMLDPDALQPGPRRAIASVSETSVAVMVVHSFQARM